jgi:hypothetical protein
LKSNLVYKTLDNIVDEKNKGYQETLPDILFMCVEKDKLMALCDLFPQTAENIKERARERRIRFMQQKNTNSLRYDQKRAEKLSSGLEDRIAEEWYTDEEADDQTGHQEDMKAFLTKLNERIDSLVGALKEADSMIVKSKDQKTMLEQIKQRRNGHVDGQQSVAEYFQEAIEREE